MDKPKSIPNLYSLAAPEFNQALQQAYTYFGQKRVRIIAKDKDGKVDGRIGNCIGVDPRPMKGSVPTSPGQDGNYLIISVKRAHCKPGQTPIENVCFMPDDVELVDPPAPAEPTPAPVTTTTTS